VSNAIVFCRHVIRSSAAGVKGLRACEGKRSPVEDEKRSRLDAGNRSPLDERLPSFLLESNLLPSEELCPSPLDELYPPPLDELYPPPLEELYNPPPNELFDPLREEEDCSLDEGGKASPCCRLRPAEEKGRELGEPCDTVDGYTVLSSVVANDRMKRLSVRREHEWQFMAVGGASECRISSQKFSRC
jgi:hypothetical protein